MPLVRIDVLRGRSEAELAAIGAAIHRALGEDWSFGDGVARYLKTPRDQRRGWIHRAAWILAIATVLSGCAAGRPTTLSRLPQGYEVLTAHCEGAPEQCQRIQVTGNPSDEEAWGFRARPALNALWREAEVFYAVGNRERCDEVRAAVGTPTEACWGPVYFRRK